MVSNKPWSLTAAGRLFTSVILTLFGGLLLAGLAEASGLGWTREQRDLAEMVIIAICFQCSALFWIAVFLRQNDLTWRDAFFARAGHWRAAGLGLVVGCVAAPALVLLQEGLTVAARKYLHWNLPAEELVERLGSPGISLATKLVIGVTAIVIAPVAEEALFRGVLYPTVKQMGHPRWALFGTSILFALAHGSGLAFIPLALFSMILIWLYELCDNLAAPIMAHCALNTLNYYWIVSTASAPGGAH